MQPTRLVPCPWGVRTRRSNSSQFAVSRSLRSSGNSYPAIVSSTAETPSLPSSRILALPSFGLFRRAQMPSVYYHTARGLSDALKRDRHFISVASVDVEAFCTPFSIFVFVRGGCAKHVMICSTRTPHTPIYTPGGT